jgi:hypothetical protein
MLGNDGERLRGTVRKWHCAGAHYRIKWGAEKETTKNEQPDRWIKSDGMRITYTEVGDDGIDVGDRDPTLRPKCCEG